MTGPQKVAVKENIIDLQFRTNQTPQSSASYQIRHKKLMFRASPQPSSQISKLPGINTQEVQRHPKDSSNKLTFKSLKLKLLDLGLDDSSGNVFTLPDNKPSN